MGMWWRADRPGDSSSSCKGREEGIFPFFIHSVDSLLPLHSSTKPLPFSSFSSSSSSSRERWWGGCCVALHTHEKGRGKTGPPAVWGGERKRRMNKKRNRMNRWKWKEKEEEAQRRGMEGGARCAAAGETSSHVDEIFKVESILKNIQRIQINWINQSIK